MNLKSRRLLSVILALTLMVTSITTSLPGFAADQGQEKNKLPAYQDVKRQLDKSEIVTAHDLELFVGDSFNVKSDFRHLDIPSQDQVKVSFHEAKNAQEKGFSTDFPDTYHAVYYVRPADTTHPAYQISCRVTVKQKEKSQSEALKNSTSPAEQKDGGVNTIEKTSGNEEVKQKNIQAASGETSGTVSDQAEDRLIPDQKTQEQKDQEQKARNQENQEQKDQEQKARNQENQEQKIQDQKNKTPSGQGQQDQNQNSEGSETDQENGQNQSQKTEEAEANLTKESNQQQDQTKDTEDHTTENSQNNDKLTAADVLRQAQKQGIHLTEMEEGETITFKAMAGSTEKRVSVTRGTHYEYSSYGLGSYETYKYHVSFGDISATAYCIQPSKHSPDSGTYTITKLADSKNLAKVCYYGTKASGEEGFFSEKHSDFSEGKRFILVHLAASYANSGSDAFSGANSTARSLAMELYNWCISQPDIPDVDMSFSEDDVMAYVEGGRQRTKQIVFRADELQTITFHLPKGVKLHNVTTGKASSAGADVEISGGTTFYLSAPLSQTSDVAASWKTTMKGSVVKDYSAFKISTGGGEQDLALVFGEGVEDEKYIDFRVSWITLGEITIYKIGEELVSASQTDDGITFRYEKKRLKNAVYNVYAGEDIKDGSGNVIHKKGELIAADLRTDDTGSATLKNVYAGIYTITEKSAPSGFYNSKESKSVKVEYLSDLASEVTFVNERQKVTFTSIKQDSVTHNPLDGGVFGLYAGNDIKNVSGTVILKKDTLIERLTTKKDGTASSQADLPVGYSYYVKELKAPENYYRNQTDTYSFRFVYTDDQQPVQTFQHIFADDRTTATIRLTKKDKETGEKPQGDAVLQGAVYGLYAKKDIVHPDGKTGVIYKAGQRVATLTTDKNGTAQTAGLYLGAYYIKEISSSTGYLLDDKEYDISADYEGDLVKDVSRSVISLETVKKQPFQVIKAADNDKTDADLLEGVGFSAYLISSLKKKADGTYDYAASEAVKLTAQGAKEMFTDQKGYAVSAALPYGTYMVLETTTPHNYKPVTPFVVRISENNPTTPQTWRVLLDGVFQAKLKIIKQDDETGRSILLPDTEFKIYDLDHKTYINQVTTYPSTKVHSSYFTNEEGYLILPQNLEIGRYRIEEIHAPEGYTLNDHYIEIKVDTDTMYHIDDVSGDAIIEVVYENHPVKGKLSITKSGEQLYDFDGEQFQYESGRLSGAVYEVYASEDIYSPDYQRDEEGNRLIIYEKDALVKIVTTDEEGTATVEDLPLGTYYVKEKTAPEGYVLNQEVQEAEFVYDGQDVPVIEQEINYVNERQKVEITVIKRDAVTTQTVAGASFGIYNKEELDGKKSAVAADTLLQTFQSDEEGRAVCTLDLPLGSYYIKELDPPEGYLISDEIIDMDASYQGQDTETISLESEMKNAPTVTEFTKSDITTGTELSGAKLSVIDKDGNAVESWVSDKDKPHYIYALHTEETYILREELAPYGYLKTTDVEFTVSKTGEIQKVEMKDEVPTGTIIISKKGEFLNKISLIRHVKGIVEHFFEYISGNLKEVQFEIYAAKDIKAADGVSPDYYKKDQLVTTITTDESGYATVEELPLGVYYVRETGTAHGHVLDEERQEVDLTYRNQDTPIVVYDKEWQNNRQKVKVELLKVEKGTDNGLAEGIFGLFAKEAIYSSEGTQLMEADEIIELKRTDQNGKLTFMADLPIDAAYYIKELYAPPGYVVSDEQQDFNTQYQGERTAEQSVSLTFEDEPTIVEITKSALTTGEELPGAHLKVTDSSGKTVDSWVSSQRPHIIKYLVADETYTLTETKPADGYVTAESIRFIIKNTARIQKVEMKDDVTKVKISKQDIGGKELPGAKLTIFDEQGKKIHEWVSTSKPHYIEMLPVGHYILREQTAPKGYLVSEDVKFEIKDTAKIQFVKMKDKPAKPSKKSHPSKTGDDQPILLWSLILLLGIAGAGNLIRLRKNQRR